MPTFRNVITNQSNQPDRYRFDQSTGSLYEYDAAQGAYLFAAKANGRTEQETISDYESELNLFDDVPDMDPDFDENSLFRDD
jgi:hypothetical protein